MTPRVHAIAIILVATFMLATITGELLGEHATVLATKTAILAALPLLVAAVMVAGASNLTLLVLSARAGRIMAAVRPPGPARG